MVQGGGEELGKGVTARESSRSIELVSLWRSMKGLPGGNEL